MLKFKKGRRNEVTVRVFTESEHFGREFFDQHESLKNASLLSAGSSNQH